VLPLPGRDAPVELLAAGRAEIGRWPRPDPTNQRKSSNDPRHHRSRPARTPTRHRLALMIGLCVFPTLTVLNVTPPMSTVLRTFVLATFAVPIVIYALMPHLHRARGRTLDSR
jgi:antibiotic biosynthesis monooxygenase (ABM) superfamily enzyme